ncbi:glutamate receptor ionotropic, NMDA 2B-like isoform X2 [Brevipalpus obovatus]
MAPTLEHQASAMLHIAKHYSWHTLSIVTSVLGGHEDFVRAIRDETLAFEDFKFTILDVITIRNTSLERREVITGLEKLKNSEARIIILYSTKTEALDIFNASTQLGITGRDYMWIVARSIVGTEPWKTRNPEFPSGMLGLYFNTTHKRLLPEIDRAIQVFGKGLESFMEHHQYSNKSLLPELTCDRSGNARWSGGSLFYKYLRGVKIKQDRTLKSSLEFNVDGTLKFVEFDVMNFNRDRVWEKIGEYSQEGLEMRDITWPGNSTSPPQGVPDRFNLRVTFLEEPPFVNSVAPDKDGRCKTSKAVKCRFARESEIAGLDKSTIENDPRYYKCCTGFCIDLLEKFSKDLGFSYELYRVEDEAWGVLSVNRTWNGLVAELLDDKADIVVTSIKINSDRQAYIDFTVPFLETGITILVSKRTGIISPKAFLEPFDTVSWIMILLVSIQLAVIFIFIFEWMSPSGYNMTTRLPKGHRFSFFRTYWLVWAILFGAAVPINCPKGLVARFMSNVWATFAVVFLAIYTANLAAFMITREDYHAFSGLEDPKLANPHMVDPPLRFGTTRSGNTEAVVKRNKPQMHAYMMKFNQSKSFDGVQAVKKGELDAFIYDAVVLDYFTGQDNDCRLLTVGSWYAMTGYGFAFPKKSKYLNKFNEKMIYYRESGDLERLRKFWFQGACKPSKSKGKLSKPLDVNQFMSAFLLLGVGILLTLGILVLEHSYFKFCRKSLSKKLNDDCFRVISLSVAKSLNMDESAKKRIDQKEISVKYRSATVRPVDVPRASSGPPKKYDHQLYASSGTVQSSKNWNQLDKQTMPSNVPIAGNRPPYWIDYENRSMMRIDRQNLPCQQNHFLQTNSFDKMGRIVQINPDIYDNYQTDPFRGQSTLQFVAKNVPQPPEIETVL